MIRLQSGESSLLAGLIRRDTPTVDGRTMGENIEAAVNYNDDVIRPLSNPVYHEGSLAVLREKARVYGEPRPVPASALGG